MPGTFFQVISKRISISEIGGFIFYRNFPIYTITHDYIYENFAGYFPKMSLKTAQKRIKKKTPLETFFIKVF